MDDKTFEATKERVRKYIEKWKHIITHWGWKFDIYYCRSFEEMPNEANEGTQAITFYRFKYLEGSIYFNIAKCEETDDDELEQLAVHELSHFLVAPIQNEDNTDLTEYVVTTISRTILGVNDAN